MATSKPPKPPGQYDVGYGRPPVHSRFPPGQSGNPAGRRKGQPTPNEIFMKEAARLVKIKRGDTVETITKHEAIIRRLLQSAMEACHLNYSPSILGSARFTVMASTAMGLSFRAK